jgi:FkbM family methyltransferase
MLSTLRISSFFKFYYLKYFIKNDNNVHQFSLRNGLKINVNKSEGDLTTLFEVFVDEDYRFMDSSIKQLKIIDIGANVGFFSLYIAKKFPNAVIYSFEPFPETFLKFTEHIKMNGLTNIMPYNFAVNDFDGSSRFYSFEWSGCNTLIDGKFDEKLHKVTEVQCRSFDSIPSITGADEFDFAKIDCEGSEYPIFLNSSDEMIRKVKRCVIEVHNSDKYSKEDLIKRFEKLGFITNSQKDILTAQRVN